MATTYRSLEIVPGESGYGRKYVWQAPVRLSHWVNAFSIAALFLTGLYIANPALAPNGEAYNHFVMGSVRQIHFVAGYFLLFGFLLRIYCFYFGNNYSRSGFPFVWRREWWVLICWRNVRSTCFMTSRRPAFHLTTWTPSWSPNR